MNSILLKMTFLLCLGGLMSCTSASSPSAKDRMSSDDFLKTQITKDTWVRPTDCRANIQAILCEVDPQTEPNQSRPCLGGEKKYIALFEKIYDELDPINKKMFCSLRKIYLENHFYATAYASSAYELNADHHIVVLPGAIIGIRKSALDLDPEFSVWATWKDQLNFTAIAKDLESPLEYPRFTVSDQNPWFLRYVITHEFGHLFDFANGLDQITPLDESCELIQDPDEFAKKCPYQFLEKTWGELAWSSFRQVKPEFDFYNRSLLCFYSCKSHMSPETDVLPFYQGLGHSVFVSTYAASSVMEDWAESWAAYWMLERGENFEIDASQNYRFKASDIFNSIGFGERKRFIDHFIFSKIKYP